MYFDPVPSLLYKLLMSKPSTPACTGQHFRSIPRRRSSSLYSNMTCTATYKHAAENARNSRPDEDEVSSVIRCLIPSRPSTKPIRLADMRSKILRTPPRPAIGRYQGSCPYCACSSAPIDYCDDRTIAFCILYITTHLVEWHDRFGDDLR